MRFKKSELEFLELYAASKDFRKEENDKVQIKVCNGEVTVSQFSLDAILITSFKKESTEEFSVVFPITQFNSLIKAIPDSEEVDISSTGLMFKNNRYELAITEGMDNYFNDVDHFLSIAKEENNGKKITITDFQKNNIVRSYMGADGLDTVALMNSYFVASNRTDVIAACSTSNAQKEDFYISKLSVVLCNMLKVDVMDFMDVEDKGIYIIKLKDTFIFIPKKEYILPNIFDEDVKVSYDHTEKVCVEKSALKDAINRIKIVAFGNLDGRIYLTTKNNQLVIESKDTGYAEEIIDSEYDKALENHSVILSVNYLNQIVSALEGNKIYISISPDNEAVAVKITDEKENYFFVHCLYNYD